MSSSIGCLLTTDMIYAQNILDFLLMYIIIKELIKDNYLINLMNV